MVNCGCGAADAAGHKATSLAAWRGGTVWSLLPTIRLSGVFRRGKSMASCGKSQLAIMPKAPAAWPGLLTSCPYSAIPSASNLEPVLSISFCNTLGWAACHEKSDGTNGSADISLATGENTCPARPPSGCNAPLMLRMRSGEALPSSAMRTAIATPAEWPTTRAGLAPSVSSSSPIALAMPGKDICRELLPPSGMSVKAWPGRSSDSSLKCGASKGISPRQEWVDAPVPCSNNTVGAPDSADSNCWTCQRKPAACTKRLCWRCGQRMPSRSQFNRGVMLVTCSCCPQAHDVRLVIALFG